MSNSVVFHHYPADIHLTWEENWGHFDPRIITDGHFVADQACTSVSSPNYIAAFIALWEINRACRRFAEFDHLDAHAGLFRLDLHFDPEELHERATEGQEMLPFHLSTFLLLFQELVLMEKKLIIARNSDLLT